MAFRKTGRYSARRLRVPPTVDGAELCPPWGTLYPAKCLMSGDTASAAVRFPSPTIPAAIAPASSPARNVSSPNSSSLRPHRGSLARPHTGDQHCVMPLARASVPMTRPMSRMSCTSKVAARVIGEGNIVCQSPWTPCWHSSAMMTPTPKRDEFTAARWTRFEINGSTLRPRLSKTPAPSDPKNDAAFAASKSPSVMNSSAE